MIFKYILICGLLHQVLGMDWFIDDCIFVENPVERTARSNLREAKLVCDKIDDGKCYDAADKDIELEVCKEYNNCLKEILDVFKNAVKGQEYGMKLYNEAISEICEDCNGFFKYVKTFQKMFELRLVCAKKT